MRPLITILSFLLFTHAVFAQKAIIKEVSEIAPYSKKKYVFPLINIPGNKKAENKINKRLQEETLNLDSSGYKKSIFELVWEVPDPNDSRWVFTNYSYKIYSNTDQYLCLSISFMGGKYMQDQMYTFVFDTFTGEEIKLEKILNPKGKKWLIEAISAGRTNRVRKQMAVLKDSMQSHRLHHNTQEEDDDAEALRLYKSCLEKDPVSDETLEYYELMLTDDRFFVTGSPCSDGRNAIRLIGLLNYKIARRIKDIEQFLSPYGKKLLLHSAHG